MVINNIFERVLSFPKVYLTASLVRLLYISKLNSCVLSQQISDFIISNLNNQDIIFSTASLNLVGSNIPYDKYTTKSHQRGQLNESLRLVSRCRSNHPFCSYASLGLSQDFVDSYTSPHAYGPQTIVQMMYELDYKAICIDISPNLTTLVHHVEHLACVPYRYTKEFCHPIQTLEHVESQYFYMNVLYHGMNFHRDGNKKLFNALVKHGFSIEQVSVDHSILYVFSIRQFIDIALSLMLHDPYIWLPNNFSDLNALPPFRN